MTSMQQHPTYPPLVVGTNPEATDRLTRSGFGFQVVFTFVIALLGMAFAALGASTGDFGMGLASALPFTFTLFFMLSLTIRTATMRGMQSIKRTALTLDGVGLHGAAQQGDITLPWSTIDRLSIRRKGKHRIMTFHLTPGVAPSDVGVDTTLSPKMFAILTKRGFQIGEVAIDTPLETLAAASGAFTNGRLGAISPS
jgi:hypothetical protein